MPNLNNLTTDELLRHFENNRNTLTTSDTEIELATRLSDLFDEAEDHRPLIDVLEEQGIYSSNAETLKAQLALAVAVKELLAEHDLADADALQDALEALAGVREAVAV